MAAGIRKLVIILEETNPEMGRATATSVRRAIACAVIENPFAGRYVEDLSELVAQGEELGALLVVRAIAALGVPGERVESFGKAAVVGEGGELEHAAALLHPISVGSAEELFAGVTIVLAHLVQSHKYLGIGTPFRPALYEFKLFKLLNCSHFAPLLFQV